MIHLLQIQLWKGTHRSDTNSLQNMWYQLHARFDLKGTHNWNVSILVTIVLIYFMQILFWKSTHTSDTFSLWNMWYQLHAGLFLVNAQTEKAQCDTCDNAFVADPILKLHTHVWHHSNTGHYFTSRPAPEGVIDFHGDEFAPVVQCRGWRETPPEYYSLWFVW